MKRIANMKDNFTMARRMGKANRLTSIQKSLMMEIGRIT